jgi:hypothetical protein
MWLATIFFPAFLFATAVTIRGMFLFFSDSAKRLASWGEPDPLRAAIVSPTDRIFSDERVLHRDQRSAVPANALASNRRAVCRVVDSQGGKDVGHLVRTGSSRTIHMNKPDINFAQIVNAVVRVASKPYIDFIESLLASGRINALEVEALNQDVHNQRLILVDLAREELAKELHADDQGANE